jgi:hypothetical protein
LLRSTGASGKRLGVRPDKARNFRVRSIQERVAYMWTNLKETSNTTN